MPTKETRRTIVDTILPASFFTSYTENGLSNAGLTADDKFAIQDVVFRFEWAFDSRRLDALAELLTDDVVLDHLWGYREGKEAAIDMLRLHMPECAGLRHQNTNPVIVPNEDGSVSVVSFILVLIVVDETGQLGLDTPVIGAHGVSTDIVRHDGGKWKIARRTFEQMRTIRAYLPEGEMARSWEATAVDRHSMVKS